MFASDVALNSTTDPLRSRKLRGEAYGADTLQSRFANAPARTLKAKEHLFCEGDYASHVYLIEAGHVCTYRMMPDGRRQVIDFAYPGDVIGLGALGQHTVNAQATVSTRVRSVPLTHLGELARSDPHLSLKLYEAVSRELIAARELLFTVSQRTASERLASFLLDLCRRSQRSGGESHQIVLPMRRSDIADFLGLTIETVSRTFTKLRNEGLIDIEQCILVTIKDARALAAIAAGETNEGGMRPRELAHA